MRPTREGSRTRGLVTSGFGFNPEQPVGEVEEPVDYLQDENAMVWYPVSGSGTTTLVQSKVTTPGAGAAISQSLSFDSAVAAGSLLVVAIATRSTNGPFSGPAGWASVGTIDANGFNGGSGALFYIIADGTEGTGPFTFNTAAGTQRRIMMAEFSGAANTFVDSAEVDSHAATTALAIGDVTPTASADALLIAFALNGGTITSIDTGYTSVDGGFVEGGINGPYSRLAYKAVTNASGDYGATTAQSSAFECAGDHLAFSDLGTVIWVPAPLTIDEDDATYEEVTGHTECWRAQLIDTYQVGRARLVIGTETAGSKTYDLEGQTLADIDADTGTLLGTFSFTATGSYTADEIEIDIDGADGYEFYRLVGPNENRRLYTVNLYSPEQGSGVTVHEDLTGRSDAGQHPASAVTVADSAGWFTGTTVETTLAELAAKAIGYEAHGNTGTAETFDAAIGWHSATLNDNCTFTLTAAPTGTVSSLFLELAQDGTGGRTITLPASVTNKTELEADQDTTLSTTSFLVLLSRDGGTTWYGGWWGQSGGSDLTIEDEGTPLATSATTLDFVGSGVTASGTGAEKTITISGAPTGSAGGDLSGTYPNPSVVDDSHNHTGATVTGVTSTPPPIMLESDHAVPFAFDEILQESDGSDFLWESA